MALRHPRRRLARSGPKREPYDRVLIVCEGKRTEPLYFQGLADRYRLSMMNIVIVGSGSDPRTVVRKAKELRSRESRHGEKYDRVYCVFDRNEHKNFKDACKEARDSGVQLARSWPCFEFWLLLHFRFSRQPFEKSGGRSAAQSCVDEVSRWLPDYAKGASEVFPRLEERLERAKAHAARTLADAKVTGEFNPSTEVHELVKYLQSLKSESGTNNVRRSRNKIGHRDLSA